MFKDSYHFFIKKNKTMKISEEEVFKVKKKLNKTKSILFLINNSNWPHFIFLSHKDQNQQNVR